MSFDFNLNQRYYGFIFLLVRYCLKRYRRWFFLALFSLGVIVFIVSWRVIYFSGQVSAHDTAVVPPSAEEDQSLVSSSPRSLPKKPGLINLEAEKIALVDVLKTIVANSQRNVIISHAIHGTVSVHWQAVPWRKALNTLAKLYQLSVAEEENLILITTRTEQLKKQRELQKIKAQQNREKPLMREMILVSHVEAHTIEKFIKRNRSLLLGTRGCIDVDERGNTLWIAATPSQLVVLRTLIKNLDHPLQQVLIKVRVVSLEKTFEKKRGFSVHPWHENRNVSHATEQTGSSPLSAFLSQSGTALSWPIPGLKLGFIGPLAVELNALQQQGRVRIVASPEVIATNHQKAVISSGEEMPYQHAGTNGGSYVTFKKVLLALTVQPDITAEGKIRLSVSINQDRPGSRLVQGIPAIATRSIHTQVLLENRATVVIGGIDEQGHSGFVSRVPFWSYVPLMGHLFKQRQQRHNHTELLLFVTPTIL